MPLLFISYKRDDRVAVTKITERLEREYSFQIWIDAVSIPGGEDWRQEIRKGIDKADVMLLMLTPDACASPQVKEEVDYAQSVTRKIIPLQIKRVTSADLEKLGVEPLNHIDFVGSHDDRFAWEKLLSDLPQVLARDRRMLNPTFRKLHRDYLRSLFTRYGTVSLAYLLDAAPREAVSLMDIYVPLFLGTLIWGEVRDSRLVDWWISTSRDSRETFPDKDGISEAQHPKQFSNMVVDASVLDLLVERMQVFVGELAAREGGIKDGEYSLWRLESEEAPALCRHLVITGGPGSGKSTLLKHLALCLAGDMLSEGHEAEADRNRLGFWPLPAYTPLFIELRALVHSAFPDRRDAVTLEKIFDYLAHAQLKPYGVENYLDDLRDQLRDGDVMIFLDGLDEVPEADQKERQEQIKSLAHVLRTQYPDCRIVVTSRTYAYERYADMWRLEGFGQVRLTNLDSDRLEELALKVFQVVLGAEETSKQVEPFRRQMESVPEELRSSPLFFTLMAAIWLNNQALPAQQRLPVTAGAIYRACVDMLIRRWTRKDFETGESLADQVGLDETQLRQLLEAIAYQVHSGGSEGDDAIFESGDIMTICRRELKLRGVDYDGLIEALAQRAGIIYERAPEEYVFAHRSFQEHLAARYLAKPERFPAQVVRHVCEQPLHWRNVTVLLPDEVEPHALWELIDRLLPSDAKGLPDHRADPTWEAIAYAGRVLRDYLPATDRQQRLYRPVLQTALAKLLTVGALTPVDRAEMGRLLAEIGDPRSGVGVRDGLPDIDWVEIAAGEFLYQNGKRLTLPTFQIARYPITYIQFQCFVDALDFNDDRWWAGMPEEQDVLSTKYRTRDVSEQRYKFGNHPRERVSWYQAVAFCRWLSARTGQDIWLPTEQEWAKAARGPDGREYPYEGDFDPAKANTSETGIGQTSPVGIFPDGASPYGLQDMSGNVWEWCLNKYDDPDDCAVDASGEPRVLRGGSWLYSQDGSRAVVRYLSSPDFRDFSLGFRVVCVPPSA